MTLRLEQQFETLIVEQPLPNVVQVSLNRPERRNAFNTRMAEELLLLWGRLSTAPPGDVRCLIVTGSGDKAFCAGADLKERRDMDADTWHRQHALYERMSYDLMNLPMPTIAAVEGAAFAGGCELALACDFIHAAESARFALTEVTLGLIPGIGGTQNLPRAIGLRRAREVLVTGRPFDARDAEAWGMVNRLTPPGGALKSALVVAETITANAPLAVRAVLSAADDGGGTTLVAGLERELAAYRPLIETKDRQEGILAFNEKRKPRFRGL